MKKHMKKIIFGVCVVILLLLLNVVYGISIQNPQYVNISVVATTNHTYRIYGSLTGNVTLFHSYKTRTDGRTLYITLYSKLNSLGKRTNQFDFVVKSESEGYEKIMLEGGKQYKQRLLWEK